VLAQSLMRRGDALMRSGDISAARLMYGRAVETRRAAAATAMARTYDPEVLAAMGVRGITGDREAAARWYRRARELGDQTAEVRLRQLGQGP
jgi:TPR repeat protein